nr:MAG TPA: hypothetical protein [Caudoviricetes sp.]
MQNDKHSLDFQFQARNDERRRDYRVEDSSRELAHKRTHTHVEFRNPNNYPQTQR